MGIFDSFKPAPDVTASAMVAITPAGKSRVESGFAVDSRHKDHYAILSTLAEGGATSIEDLSAEVKMNSNKVKNILRTMIPRYVVVQSGVKDGFG